MNTPSTTRDAVDAHQSDADIQVEEAISLVWVEADLLDRHDYVPWLQLWANEGRYVIPIDPKAENFEDALNIAYDDREMREARVKRLRSGFAMSSAPAARTVRTVSRFVVVDRTPGTLTLRAAQQIVEFKYERTRVLAADVTYRLVREAADLRLADKIVRLINSDDALHGIGYLF